MMISVSFLKINLLFWTLILKACVCLCEQPPVCVVQPSLYTQQNGPIRRSCRNFTTPPVTGRTESKTHISFFFFCSKSKRMVKFLFLPGWRVRTYRVWGPVYTTRTSGNISVFSVFTGVNKKKWHSFVDLQHQRDQFHLNCWLNWCSFRMRMLLVLLRNPTNSAVCNLELFVQKKHFAAASFVRTCDYTCGVFHTSARGVIEKFHSEVWFEKVQVQ